MNTKTTSPLKFSKDYETDFGYTNYSSHFEISGRVAFDPNIKYNKKTCLINLGSNENLIQLLKVNGIKINSHEKFGNSVFVTVKSHNLRKNDKIKCFAYIKRFTDKGGNFFNSLVLAD